MARKIFVCDDGSSHRPVAWAAANLVKRKEDELHVVQVLPPDGFPHMPVQPWHKAKGGTYAAEASSREALGSEAEIEALDVVSTFGVSKQQFRWHIMKGIGDSADTGHKILQLVQAEGGTVIVVGNRGMGALKRGLLSVLGLGSVSEYLTKNANVPVVVVRPSAEGTAAKIKKDQRRICAAFDGSPPSEAALAWTVREVLDPQDELYILTVDVDSPVAESAAIQVFPPPAGKAGQQAPMQRVPSGIKQAEALVVRAVDTAERNGAARSQIRAAVIPVKSHASSDIGAGICQYAKDIQVDLVGVGSRGHGSKGLTGLGSASTYLVHHAPCAVLISKEGTVALP